MQYRRTYIPNACYFFTVNLLDRKKKLLTENINCLRMTFAKIKSKHPFEINAVVILPDHLHMIMTLPKNDFDYSKRWNLIKGQFSHAIDTSEKICESRIKKRERGIWQRRFWEHLIRDNNDYEKHVDYIHYNPVKHGYVTKPTDWQYSSIHRYIAQDILPAGWAVDIDKLSGGFGE